jgi:hypothetical protein
MASNWYNADGLNVKQHGEYEREQRNFVNRVRALNIEGAEKCLIMDIDLELVGASATWKPADRNNDGTNDGFTKEDAYLPIGSAITRAYMKTTEIAAGGTDFVVGTYQEDGDTIDADAVLDATDGAAANMSAVGEMVPVTGALMTLATAGVTENAWLAVTTNGTFTAGKGTLYIFYI